MLAEHGGIWLDASTYAYARLEDWLLPLPEGVEFGGFYLEGFTNIPHFPVIESWFFACRPRSEFVTLWRDEFLRLMDFASAEDYVQDAITQGVDLQEIMGPAYLAIHVAAQIVLQLRAYPLERLVLFRAEDGPYRYLVSNEWQSELAVRSFVERHPDPAPSHERPVPFSKLRSCERHVFENDFDELYNALMKSTGHDSIDYAVELESDRSVPEGTEGSTEG